MSVFTGAFWRATAERVISSIAGGALSAIGTDAFDILEMNAQAVVGIALGAGLISLLKALVANNVGAPGPSLGSVERLNPGRHAA